MPKYLKSQKIIFVLLLVWFVGASLSQIKTKSFTTDEIIHLPAGYTYLKTFDYRVNPEHPILPKIWSALPWAMLGPDDSINQKSWENSGKYYWNNYSSDRDIGIDLLFNKSHLDWKQYSSQIMMLLLTVLFFIFSTIFVKNTIGVIPSLFYLTLSVFNPQYLGHGYLVTTDMALAVSSFIALVFFSKFIEKPTTASAIYLGLTSALMLLCKHTGIIFIAFFVLYFIYLRIFQKKLIPIKYYLLIFIIIYATIFIVYLPGSFNLIPELKPEQLKNIDESWAFNSKSIYITHFLRLIFVPAIYLKGLFMVVIHAGAGHSAYLMGQISRVGWWYYFPIAFILKNSVFLLVMIGVLFYKNKFYQKSPLAKIFIWAMFFYLLVAILSKTNLGIRHLMPIYPILFYLLADAFSRFKSAQIQRNFALICLVLFSISSIRVFPNYLNYFSEIIGSPKNGGQYLADSNIDWGQEAKNIAKYQKENNIDYLYADYFWLGYEGLTAYGVKFIPLDYNDIPEHGYFVFGSSAVFSNPEIKNWLKQYDYDIINNSVYIIKQ